MASTGSFDDSIRVAPRPNHGPDPLAIPRWEDDGGSIPAPQRNARSVASVDNGAVTARGQGPRPFRRMTT